MPNPNVIVEDGKPTFIGQEDPHNPPVPKSDQGSKMVCPVCGDSVDYLVGMDTQDGGRQGCEGCWRPSKEKTPIPVGVYDTSKEII